MTKKHFEAMANYLTELASTGCTQAEHDCVYRFALYLCNTFGERFDRAKFDAWIEKKAKA